MFPLKGNMDRELNEIKKYIYEQNDNIKETKKKKENEPNRHSGTKECNN